MKDGRILGACTRKSVTRSAIQAALIVGPFAGAYRIRVPAGNSKGDDGGRFYRLRLSDQPQCFQLGGGDHTAGGGVKDGHFGKIGFVFAFVVRGAGNARGARGGRIGPGAFPEPAGEVFCILGVSEAGYGYPSLVITGASLERREGRLPYSFSVVLTFE
jgi:hypothetical protein